MSVDYCLYNDVGRVSWIENLAPDGTGDCAGPLYEVLGREASLCERHYLQLRLINYVGAVVVVRKVAA